MTQDKPDLRDQLKARLLENNSEVPTSGFRRLGRTALTVLRSGRALRKGRSKRRDGDAPALELAQLSKIVEAAGQLKGVAMKMGQIMSYIDVAMPEELRAALSVLQTHAQPMPFKRVEEILRTDLGERAEVLLSGMSQRPMAAASIGQVHRACLNDGTAVAVKIRYPEIEEAIKSDFGPARLGTAMVRLFYPHARIDDFIAEARARFLEECDYLHEAHIQARFRELFTGHPVLAVPAVHVGYCARQVLTTTLKKGLHFEAYLKEERPALERDRMGEALFEFYIGTLFRHGLYNCDPHPGNYLFQEDGRIAMLDYGCAREFPPEFLNKLVTLTRAVHDDDRALLHQVFLGLGMVREGKKYDFDNARGLVRAFYGPMLNDVHQAMELGAAREMGSIMKSKRQLMKLSLPGEFLFLFRIRFGLMSILARLGARANWYRLERRFLEGS